MSGQNNETWEELREIEQLLYREADCLDRPDLETWLTLYTEDGTYWMPTLEDQPDPLNHISLFYDDRVMMEIRRINYTNPGSAAKEHPYRASHIISNIRVKQRDSANDALTVTSNFQAVVYYREEKRYYGGTYEHQLVRQNGDYLIRNKRVNIIDCEGLHKAMVMYL